MARTRFNRTAKDLNHVIKTLNGKVQKRVLDKAHIDTMKYYVDERLPLKFKGKVYNPEYKPNSPEYERRKKKKVGNRPQLVYTGTSRNRILLSARVRKHGNRIVAQYSSTPYIRYQIAQGRNFAAFNARDRRAMKRFLIRRIKFLRNRIRTGNKI